VREKLLGAAFFVLAALANLPIVYRLVGADAAPPLLTLAFGFVAMGLAWGGGFHLEGRHRWFVLLTGVLGVLEGGASWFVAEARPWGYVSGALSVAALIAVRRR
jgi:hypothetical protein